MGGSRDSLRLRRAIGGALGALACAAALGGAATAAGAAPGAAETTGALAAELAAGGHAVPLASGREAAGAGARRAPQAVTASGLWFDAVGDNQFFALDLREMLAFTEDGDGRYAVAITMDTNALTEGDFVATYVNADGDAATGSPTFGGADYAVGILGRFGTDLIGVLRWNGAGFDPVDVPSLIGFPDGLTDVVWSVRAADLGIGAGVTTTLAFGTLFDDGLDLYADFAPEPGDPPFPFTTGALVAPPPPPPPPPPAPPAPAPVVAPPAGAPAAAASRPLAVRTFALRRAGGGVRVTLGWVRGDGRVVWRLELRARGRAIRARGAGWAGARQVTRLVRLPASWRGARVTARLVLENRSTRLVRVRSLVV